MAKPAKARVEEKGARPFGPVRTAAIRPWPLTPRAEPQTVTKPAKVRLEEEKRAWPFDPVSTASRRGGDLAPGHLLRVLRRPSQGTGS